MLGTDRFQRIFHRALSPIYEDATIRAYAQDDIRDPTTGTFMWILSGGFPVKAQRDECTEAQRAQDGYSAQDVRFMVLQYGVASGVVATEDGGLILTEGGDIAPNTDYRMTYRGQDYRIMSVMADPARVYWDFRARLMP